MGASVAVARAGNQSRVAAKRGIERGRPCRSARRRPQTTPPAVFLEPVLLAGAPAHQPPRHIVLLLYLVDALQPVVHELPFVVEGARLPKEADLKKHTQHTENDGTK